MVGVDMGEMEAIRRRTGERGEADGRKPPSSRTGPLLQRAFRPDPCLPEHLDIWTKFTWLLRKRLT